MLLIYNNMQMLVSLGTILLITNCSVYKLTLKVKLGMNETVLLVMNMAIMNCK